MRRKHGMDQTYAGRCAVFLPNKHCGARRRIDITSGRLSFIRHTGNTLFVVACCVRSEDRLLSREATGSPGPVQGSQMHGKIDLLLLDQCHRSMREAIASFPKSNLNTKSSNSKYTNACVIYGIANHDIYHAGQIQLLKRLMKE